MFGVAACVLVVLFGSEGDTFSTMEESQLVPFEIVNRGILRLTIATLFVAAIVPSQAARAQTARVQTRNGSTAAPAEEAPFQLSGPTPSLSGVPGYHILPAKTAAGQRTPLEGPVSQSRTRAMPYVKPLAGLPRPGFFPADLSVIGSAPLVLTSGSSENIYVNCADQSCWGNPEGFLSDLAVSKFIHVVDQYVGSKKNSRYPLSTTTVLTTGVGTFLTSADIENVVEGAAALPQVGTGHIFHVFLPQGTVVCPETNSCYSPDNPSTFTLCAYHSFVNVNDNTTLLYTVEPFQEVNGCALAPPNPNGQMVDSTNSALSHELFESISDPFPNTRNTAWIAENSSPEEGNEMADICHGPGDGAGNTIVPSYLLAPGHTYQTQLEYSNAKHGCVVSP